MAEASEIEELQSKLVGLIDSGEARSEGLVMHLFFNAIYPALVPV